MDFETITMEINCSKASDSRQFLKDLNALAVEKNWAIEMTGMVDNERNVVKTRVQMAKAVADPKFVQK